MTDAKFAKLVVWVNGLVPAVLLVWDYNHGGLGAGPARYVVHTTGMVALVFLGLTLLVTPVRQVTGWTWVYGVRRTLGLYAFYYAAAHLVLYWSWWQAWDLGVTVSEIFSHTYLMLGFIGLALMVPLWATSFDKAIRKLGPVKWKWVHRLIYVTIFLGGVHFYLQAKSDKSLPTVFMLVIDALLLWRVGAYFVRRGRNRAAIARGEKRWSGVMRVEKIVQETADVKTFRLVPRRGGDVPFGYLPGQFLTLDLPIEGKSVRRSYTIASTPSRSGAIEVTIKRSTTGVSSVYMHDRVREGELIRMSAPSGRFVFTGEGDAGGTPALRGAAGVVMLAGGVGITPLMAMVRYLTDRAWKGEIYLLYVNKREEDIVFRREIEGLMERHGNLHVAFLLTRAGEGWSGGRGRLTEELLLREVPGVRTLPIYLCGPGEMIAATQGILAGMGVPAGNVHTESFGAARGAVKGTASMFSVTFARSQQTAAIASDVPVLNVAEDLGVAVQSECRVGICGTCKCRLLSGRVTMETQEALTEGDRARGVILLCQALASEDVVVDL